MNQETSLTSYNPSSGSGQRKGARQDSTHRPWPVTALCVFILLFSLIRGLRAALALVQWSFLESLPINVSPLYLFLNGALWSLAGFTLLFGLWRASSWSRPGTMIASILFSLWTWFDLLWIKASEARSTRWPFTAGVTLLGLGLVWISLNLPASKAYFDQD